MNGTAVGQQWGNGAQEQQEQEQQEGKTDPKHTLHPQLRTHATDTEHGIHNLRLELDFSLSLFSFLFSLALALSLLQCTLT